MLSLISSSPAFWNDAAPPIRFVEPRIFKSNRSELALTAPATVRLSAKVSVGVLLMELPRRSRLCASTVPLKVPVAPKSAIARRSMPDTAPVNVTPVVALTVRSYPAPVRAAPLVMVAALRRRSAPSVTGPARVRLPPVGVMSASRVVRVTAVSDTVPATTDLVNISMVAPVAVRLPTAEAVPELPKPRR